MVSSQHLCTHKMFVNNNNNNNNTCNNRITLEGEDLEDVKTHAYLGSSIDEHGGSDAYVVWMDKARAAYLQLKNIWN
ncbi:unnamed protein product [Schistosoma curassoni]|uniref:SCP domain-containing protein n=1 Tax=Schistosoma curassoni TaxID=6186 RepID=A0A183JJC1_9TREM|nr:unnamed protein product [Schistosoma curassoni]